MRHNLPLLEPCWLSSITSLFSSCLSIVLRRIYYLAGCRGDANWTVVPWGLLFCVCENWGCFPFSSQWGLHWIATTSQKMMDSGLATSLGYLRTLKCILSVHIDLCIFSFFRWSWNWLSSVVNGSSFFQSLPLPSATCAVWLLMSSEEYVGWWTENFYLLWHR